MNNAIKENLCGVLKCLSNFVNFGNGSKKYTRFNSEIYKVLPSIFYDIAYHSRIGSGYRLLLRCVRHGMDTKAFVADHAKFVRDATGKIIIVLENQIPASMRNKVYDTRCAIDEDGVLVACKCTCECGSQGNERVTCVHILPVAFQLTIFMVACLAENILLELSALWASETIEQSLSVKEAEVMKNNVAMLIDAGSECNETPYETTAKISDMLRMFAVGTEKRKKSKCWHCSNR